MFWGQYGVSSSSSFRLARWHINALLHKQPPVWPKGQKCWSNDGRDGERTVAMNLKIYHLNN